MEVDYGTISQVMKNEEFRRIQIKVQEFTETFTVQTVCVVDHHKTILRILWSFLYVSLMFPLYFLRYFSDYCNFYAT